MRTKLLSAFSIIFSPLRSSGDTRFAILESVPATLMIFHLPILMPEAVGDQVDDLVGWTFNGFVRYVDLCEAAFLENEIGISKFFPYLVLVDVDGIFGIAHLMESFTPDGDQLAETDR